MNCCVIIHCLEVSCKEDQITSAQPPNSELLHNNSLPELIYFLSMVVFNLAIFATFDNDSYSVQVPKTQQKEGIRA